MIDRNASRFPCHRRTPLQKIRSRDQHPGRGFSPSRVRHYLRFLGAGGSSSREGARVCRIRTQIANNHLHKISNDHPRQFANFYLKCRYTLCRSPPVSSLLFIVVHISAFVLIRKKLFDWHSGEKKIRIVPRVIIQKKILKPEEETPQKLRSVLMHSFPIFRSPHHTQMNEGPPQPALPGRPLLVVVFVARFLFVRWF